jgi:hypothetical protein
MPETKPPMGLDPNMGSREFVLEVDAEALEKMRKVGSKNSTHRREPHHCLPLPETRAWRWVEAITRRRPTRSSGAGAVLK